MAASILKIEFTVHPTFKKTVEVRNVAEYSTPHNRWRYFGTVRAKG